MRVRITTKGGRKYTARLHNSGREQIQAMAEHACNLTDTGHFRIGYNIVQVKEIEAVQILRWWQR